ncbi:5-dehydro-4-deoxy-D-glucuronate isomerase [Cohaesibacter celericrescens]|uniref:4-deoxy-L-threo-5-hexosulose-uronate ketol-isomerase n=1 Tax=Cohaesibacter celericrescens TaxID=2067669 RepID=A0A2N5XME8_9HYPH|nr:5-dehydro-4-deoxy-D-glucuronate isomerase [Cohaesibacter celericrescens]PLW75664.1 5-dehydro-4-deoxy-D-glucuronate isomerase [Cohaesibacter celericrescens]
MLTVKTTQAVNPEYAKTLDTAGLRDKFLSDDLFTEGEIRLNYTHYDRMIVGGAVPNGASLTLDHVAECGTPSILDRREMGVVNIGEAGTVSAAGTDYALNRGDVLYLPKGAGAVTFSGKGRFYITSAPAHTALAAKLIKIEDAACVKLGAPETANERTIYQFIHPLVMESCQLVLGYTQLHDGSIWNTMPAHTHDRRMEAYCYFNLGDDSRVFHFMGDPAETRHLVAKNEDVVVSPPWSIHCGAGTSNYTFIWAMAGDNVDYTDMDFVAMKDLR